MSYLLPVNYVNSVAFVANVLVTYGIGVAGLFGLPTNDELSEKYQTLLTPTGFSFSIWAIIFLSQAIFVVIQSFALYNKSPLVIDGVGWYYAAVCAAQVGWTVAFSMEVIWLSELFMLAILFSLVTIVGHQYIVGVAPGWKEYAFLKFPFNIHCGWIIAASFVNTAVLLVKFKINPDTQYFFAVASLIAFVLIAGFALGYPRRPDFTIPLVLCWATFGVYFELRDPEQLLLVYFSNSTITQVRNGALITCIVIFVAILVRLVLGTSQLAEESSPAPVSNVDVDPSNQRVPEEDVYVRTDDDGDMEPKKLEP